jgi:Cu/Ag efflux protein CusF
MFTYRCLRLASALALIILAGCGGAPDPSNNKVYDLKGTVIAVDAKKPSVTLDHEDISGLMKSMVMDFDLENAKIAEGFKPGDRVQGKLKVESGKYAIIRLEKLASATK